MFWFMHPEDLSLNRDHDGQFSPDRFLVSGGTVGIITANPTVNL